MKKYLFIAIFATLCLVLKSCATQQPLSPVSSETVIIESKLPKEKVWDNLVDYMATKGFNIKIIDKSSGLVVSEDYSFANSQTTADKDGVLKNDQAYVVIRDGKTAGTVMGQANIRIKDNSSGGTTINVNIVNLRAYSVESSYGGLYNPKRETTIYRPVASTQVFENYLAKKISE